MVATLALIKLSYSVLGYMKAGCELEMWPRWEEVPGKLLSVVLLSLVVLLLFCETPLSLMAYLDSEEELLKLDELSMILH